MYFWNDFIPDASASPWIRSGKTKKMVIDRLAIESFMEQFFLFWRLGLLSNDLICLPTSSIPRTQSSVPKYLVLSEMKKYIKLLFRTRNSSLLKVYLYTQKECIIPFFIITWWHYQVFLLLWGPCWRYSCVLVSSTLITDCGNTQTNYYI